MNSGRPVRRGRAGRLPTPADRPLLYVAWSLGWASPAAIAGLGAPGRPLVSVAARLRVLAGAGYLRSVRLAYGPPGHRLLYTPTGQAGRVDPGLVDGWRPPLAAAAHTVAVGQALLAAQRPALAPPVRAAGWRGEAELRAWSVPGQALPDGQVDWQGPGRTGRWLLEVDRGTEGRAAWRRKLARYLDLAAGHWVVALTPGPVRARHLANLAVESGVQLLALPAADWAGGADPQVLSAPHRRRLPMSAALLTAPGSAHR